jgi:hypothetical protein
MSDEQPDLQALAKLRDAMLEQLEGETMDGLSLEDLRDAMNRPHALETIAQLLPLEATAVSQGEPAPDFTLARLPGHGAEATRTVTLSDHFGRRPVALVFGSYT